MQIIQTDDDDVRWKTEQPHLSATVQARLLSLFGHVSTWMKTTQYPAGPEINERLPEQSN